MLETLSFLIPPASLGTVTIYPLSEAFGAAWRQLPGYSDSGAKPRTPAYTALATALSAVTAQPVVLMPDTAGIVEDELAERAVLVTTKPIRPSLLEAATRAWEMLIRGDQDANTLAPLLTATKPTQRKLSSFIEGAKDGRPRANAWFYRVATWSYAQQLASATLDVAGYGEPVTWRMDTSGSLWSWKHPVSHQRYATTGYALHKLDLRIITLPGEPRFVLNILPTFTRLAPHWASTRTALMDHGNNTDTLLRLHVGHRRTADNQWEPYVRNYAADVVQACGLKALKLGTNDDLRSLTGTTRALVPGPCEFPLGKGTGVKFDLLTARFAAKALPALEQVTYQDTSIRLPQHIKGRINPADIDTAIGATGHPRARILALYTEPHTRHRMASTLSAYAATQNEPRFIDGRDTALTERLTVRFQHLPELASPNAVDWEAELNPLLPTDDALNAAWLETPWKPTTTRQSRLAARRGAPQPVDHKNTLRRHLAGEQIVTQFLRTLPPAEPAAAPADLDADQQDEEEESARDYKAENALRDLLFRSGILDTRIARNSSLTHPALFIGIHLRQQRESSRKPGGAQTTQMVEVLTAVHASGKPEIPWRITTYDHHTSDWLPQAEGQTAFHTQPIGQSGHARHRDGAELVREHIESALRLLPLDNPIVLFLDAEAARTIWPGLQHAQHGQGLLPGRSLHALGTHPAIVCFNTSYGEVPQPVDRPDGRHTAADRPLPPQDRLYQRTTRTGTTTWILAQASRTFTGFGGAGRAGQQHTRFSIPKENKQFLRNDWHSFTAVHFNVIDPGHWHGREDVLAQICAEQCHQHIAGDFRTKHPVPLHAAKLIDQAHPEFRGPDMDSDNTDNQS